MNDIQGRVQQFRRARRLYFSLGSFGAALIMATVAMAGDVSGERSEVRFDPTFAPPAAQGSALLVLPQQPQIVVSPLTFNFNVVGNLLAMQSGTPTQQALAANVVNGFLAAGDRWRSYFADPITVSIDIDFGPLGNGVLGGSTANHISVLYANVRTALQGDSQSADDAVAVANLQAGPAMDFLTNDTSFINSPSRSPRVRDSDTSGTNANNNRFLSVTKANAKALGISVPAGSDANITFTDFSDFASPQPTNLSWDFDPSNGISANSIDFVGVATHEIGHTMGFESGVDDVDYYGSPSGPGKPFDLDPLAVFSVLDLYRYSANSLSQPSQPAGGLKDLAYNRFDASSTPYFSLNGGTTNLAQFSTGYFNGDAHQASHWRDNLGIGIMDPTIGTTELGVVTTLDRRAFDVIGWNPQVVPEPAGMALFFVAMVGLSIFRSKGTMRLR